MKQIVSISLGSSSDDYEFETEFMGHDFRVRRIGTDGDVDKAADFIREWDYKVDAFGLGNVKFPYISDSKSMLKKITDQLYMVENFMDKVKRLGANAKSPVTAGDALRHVSMEWAIRCLEFKMDNYFTNARVFFPSGMYNYRIAGVMTEFTENLTFADPVLENGIPKFLNSFKELEMYGSGIHSILNWVPTRRFASSAVLLRDWNKYIYRRAMQKASVIVVPYYNFFKYLEDCGAEELGGKAVITSTAYDDRVSFLKDRGVDVIFDTTPKILKRVVGVNVLEAMILAALGKKPEELSDDDILEIISNQKMEPRVIYPSGETRRINRFAFVIHPLSQEDFKKEKSVAMLTQIPGAADVVEKVMAYSPPFIYSKMSGIKSPAGVEAEGWLISVGGTPKQMMTHSPEFTYKRLLMAAKMAKRLGAQIMGLGAFTKVVGDAGLTVSRQAEIPITTGNSYSASGALWAAADAVRRMGLVKVEKGKKIKAKTMVVGATGAIGSVCCRLLALAFDELYMVGRNTAKLLALKESILKETPDVEIHLSTRADNHLGNMDVIVTSTSGMGKKILDITKVKPGCVITDVARPLDLPPSEVAKRPDVLVIESGEIELPGDVEMKNIGLPQNVVYACLAETIVLALDGRFETFTVGRDIEWQKVKEIYQMGLRHGMKLAAISGVNGVFTDEDIQCVRDLAIEARAEKDKAEEVATEEIPGEEAETETAES